ncbi:hypothetical protein HYZ06_02365 [Candidatus Daviesbacteria bacterium]|nr:hypothetical protein [Candidatus Daviesbacteria bacterium]
MAESTVEIPTDPKARLVWRILTHFPSIGPRPTWFECNGFTEINGPQVHTEYPTVVALEKLPDGRVIVSRFKTPTRRTKDQVPGMIYVFQQEEESGRFLYKVEFNPGDYEGRIQQVRQGLPTELQTSIDLTQVEINGLNGALLDRNPIIIGSQP